MHMKMTHLTKLLTYYLIKISPLTIMKGEAPPSTRTGSAKTGRSNKEHLVHLLRMCVVMLPS